MKIGKYDIEMYVRDGVWEFWIMKESGEGLKINENDLEKVIDKFYAENF